MITSFGTRELIRCLRCLGFKQQPQVGSRHLKFSSTRPVQKGKRPFVIVLQNKTTYDPITQRSYIREIKILGFTKEEILNCMK